MDPKVLSTSKGSNSSDDKTVVSNLVSSGNEVQEVKKDKDQVGGSKDGVGNDKAKSGSNGEIGLKESHTVPKGGKGSNDGKNGKPSGGLESKEMHKEVGNGENVKPVREDGARREECGLSNMCTVEENKLVACLRVPGDDSMCYILYLWKLYAFLLFICKFQVVGLITSSIDLSLICSNKLQKQVSID